MLPGAAVAVIGCTGDVRQQLAAPPSRHDDPRAILFGACHGLCRTSSTRPASPLPGSKGLLRPCREQVGPLITWAAFHLGGGFAAEAAIDQLQDAVGWKSLATLLNVDSFDSLEAITLYTRSDEHRHGA